MIIYAVHDECHGIIGYYANEDKAKEVCKENAKGYGIDPKTAEFDYYGNNRWWGYGCSCVERIEVIE